MTAIKSRSLLPEWTRHDHPVYDLEVRRRVENRALSALRLGCVPSILAASALALSVILATAVLGQITWLVSWYNVSDLTGAMLGWAVATLAIIGVAAGAMVNILVIAQTAPTVSGEIELQSWRLLRTTTLTLKEIIFAKYAAALRQLRGPLLGLMIVRAAAAITILLFTANSVLRGMFYYMDATSWASFWREVQWLPVTLLYIIAFLWFVLQPLVQLFLNGAIGMVASVYSNTRAQSFAAALVGRLALWVGVGTMHLAIGLGLLFLHSQWSSAPYSQFDAYNAMPSPDTLTELWVSSLLMGGYVLAFFSVQVAGILLLLGVMLRRARHLGV
jgi:hypothetical protein